MRGAGTKKSPTARSYRAKRGAGTGELRRMKASASRNEAKPRALSDPPVGRPHTKVARPQRLCSFKLLGRPAR